MHQEDEAGEHTASDTEDFVAGSLAAASFVPPPMKQTSAGDGSHIQPVRHSASFRRTMGSSNDSFGSARHRRHTSEVFNRPLRTKKKRMRSVSATGSHASVGVSELFEKAAVQSEHEKDDDEEREQQTEKFGCLRARCCCSDEWMTNAERGCRRCRRKYCTFRRAEYFAAKGERGSTVALDLVEPTSSGYGEIRMGCCSMYTYSIFRVFFIQVIMQLSFSVLWSHVHIGEILWERVGYSMICTLIPVMMYLFWPCTRCPGERGMRQYLFYPIMGPFLWILGIWYPVYYDSVPDHMKVVRRPSTAYFRRGSSNRDVEMGKLGGDEKRNAAQVGKSNDSNESSKKQGCSSSIDCTCQAISWVILMATIVILLTCAGCMAYLLLGNLTDGELDYLEDRDDWEYVSGSKGFFIFWTALTYAAVSWVLSSTRFVRGSTARLQDGTFEGYMQRQYEMSHKLGFHASDLANWYLLPIVSCGWAVMVCTVFFEVGQTDQSLWNTNNKIEVFGHMVNFTPMGAAMLVITTTAINTLMMVVMGLAAWDAFIVSEVVGNYYKMSRRSALLVSRMLKKVQTQVSESKAAQSLPVNAMFTHSIRFLDDESLRLDFFDMDYSLEYGGEEASLQRKRKVTLAVMPEEEKDSQEVLQEEEDDAEMQTTDGEAPVRASGSQTEHGGGKRMSNLSRTKTVLGETVLGEGMALVLEAHRHREDILQQICEYGNLEVNKWVYYMTGIIHDTRKVVEAHNSRFSMLMLMSLLWALLSMTHTFIVIMLRPGGEGSEAVSDVEIVFGGLLTLIMVLVVLRAAYYQAVISDKIEQFATCFQDLQCWYSLRHHRVDLTRTLAWFKSMGLAAKIFTVPITFNSLGFIVTMMVTAAGFITDYIRIKESSCFN